jgi:hypothetical protein
MTDKVTLFLRAVEARYGQDVGLACQKKVEAEKITAEKVEADPVAERRLHEILDEVLVPRHLTVAQLQSIQYHCNS